MSRILRLIAATLFAALLLLAGLLRLSRAANLPPPTPGWRLAVDSYLSAAAAGAAGRLVLVAAQPAENPHDFAPALLANGIAGNATLATDYVHGANGPTAEEVAFPPTDAWCVLLREGERRHVIFVVPKESIYAVAWLVADGPRSPFTAQVMSDMERLGCPIPPDG